MVCKVVHVLLLVYVFIFQALVVKCRAGKDRRKQDGNFVQWKLFCKLYGFSYGLGSFAWHSNNEVGIKDKSKLMGDVCNLPHLAYCQLLIHHSIQHIVVY